jgi:hypothetical protein
MRKILVAAMLMLGACSDAEELTTFRLPDLTEDPGGFNGERVKIIGGYYGAFEISVLTSGFEESSPPQPVGPLVWVFSSAPQECLKTAEMGVRFAENVEATGIFRYDPDGGFGHLGAYEIALDDATISCA